MNIIIYALYILKVMFCIKQLSLNDTMKRRLSKIKHDKWQIILLITWIIKFNTFIEINIVILLDERIKYFVKY